MVAALRLGPVLRNAEQALQLLALAQIGQIQRLLCRQPMHGECGGFIEFARRLERRLGGIAKGAPVRHDGLVHRRKQSLPGFAPHLNWAGLRGDTKGDVGILAMNDLLKCGGQPICQIRRHRKRIPGAQDARAI